MENVDHKIHDDEPVSGLLSGLKRVEAPNDFDFRVKARIADSNPTKKAASWLPASVRYAVPLGLLLMVGGYFAFNTIYPPNNIDVPVVAEVQPANIAPINDTPSNDVVLPSNLLASENPVVKPPELENSVIPKDAEKRLPSSDPKTTSPGGGSFDEAIRKSRQILPRGFDPNPKTPVNAKDFDRNFQIPAKDVLAFIGIQAAFTGAGWKAGSVAPGSIAERSGVKAGDLIEAVNDQALAEKTSFGNKFTGKSLRVRRDGQSIKIELKP